ncbi:MAG TPA: hypothetical protein VLE19_07495 [Pyrinomonadaceae bacterium]|nr:hypothetical protein [Pyrinomonadaceae bacterium]
MQRNPAFVSWKTDLDGFGKRNKLRPTRIEVLDRADGVESDFWLEDGLLLSGIDIEEDRTRGLSVDIMLQTTAAGDRNHLTHRVAGVTRLNLAKPAEHGERLEIEDAAGTVTIVRFES